MAGRQQRRVMDTFDVRMPGQVLCDLLGIVAARFMRSDNVSSERLNIQQECGSSWVPMAPRKARIGLRLAREPMTAPPMRSLWPPTYLVSE